MVTRGSVRLASIALELAPLGGKAEVARRAETPKSVVGGWILGTGRPNTLKRMLLRAHFGIPLDDWLTDEERRIVKRAEAA